MSCLPCQEDETSWRAEKRINKKGCEEMKIISSQPFLCGKNGKPQPPLPPQGVDANRSDDTLSLKISCRNAARAMRGGDFSTLWRLCIESPSQPKLASSLHNKRLSYWRLTGFGRNDERARAGFFIICARWAPPSPSAAEPLSPPERSDATLLHNLRR